VADPRIMKSIRAQSKCTCNCLRMAACRPTDQVYSMYSCTDFW